MGLIEKLTAVADAIRSKTGSTDEMTLDQMAAAISGIETGGGSSAFHSGSFTPAENVLTATVDVGNSFDRFLLVPNAELADLGIGAKTFFLFFCDRTKAQPYRFIYSGNSGFTGSSPTTYSTFNFSMGYGPTIGETQITFKNGTSGATLGYFVAGVTYRWIAW